MLVILIVILILIGVAVVGSIYSNFMVFHSNFSETENYHRAYYSSISALERAELVTKQRQPGYEGSGGFILGTGQGSYSNGGSDKSLSGFSYYGDNKDDTSVFRTIKSKTSRIPATGNGDVEWMLSYNNPNDSDDPANSSNYNMMNYENAEVFLLYNDNSEGNPYKYTSTRKDGGLNFGDVEAGLKKEGMIKGEIRLPKVLLNSGFGLLDTGNALVGQNGILPTNDAIVDWQIRGYSADRDVVVCGGKHCIPFTIYSTQSVAFGGSDVKIIKTGDSVFREDDINNTLNFEFGNNGRSPFNNDRGRDSITIIGEGKSDVTPVDNLWSVLKYDIYTLFCSTNMRFSLLNLLQGKGNNIYPFLEYYIDFGENEVPDKYFTIDAEGAYKDYKVDTIIKKPTSKESIFGNFTSIF